MKDLIGFKWCHCQCLVLHLKCEEGELEVGWFRSLRIQELQVKKDKIINCLTCEGTLPLTVISVMKRELKSNFIF